MVANHIDLIDLIELNNNAFTAAVSAPGALDLAVPSCPEWTVADLVEHLGEVQTWWRYALRGGGQRPDENADHAAAAKPGTELLDWWQLAATELVATLREVPAQARCWCWWNFPHVDTAQALAWRQVHEAVIHRWDAENAVGTPTPLDSAIAADGVTEFLARFAPSTGWQGPAGTIRLHATDLDQSWERTPGAPGPTTVLSGSAPQLDLLLWRRIPVSELTVTGDEALVTVFRAWPELN